MVGTIVRCPYCVNFDLNAFMPMVRCLGGKFVCVKCGYAVMRWEENFRCRCRGCLAQDELIPTTARAG